MANILDIFRTHTGDKLLKKSSEITKLEPNMIQNAFIFIFPALLCHLKNNDGLEIDKKNKALVDLVENGDIISFGKNRKESFFPDSQEKIFLQFAPILNIEENKLEKLLFIATAVLASIISEMTEKSNSNLREILKNLSGFTTKYNRDFIQVLMKNPEDPNFIESPEEIHLDKNDDDPSILGGYAGGR